MGPRRSALLFLALLGALALCCAAPALALQPAGDGWYWQLPQPQGQILNGVAMPDGDNAWAVGYGGTIMHSGDGGGTWAVQASPVVDPLAAVTFTDRLHGVAVGGLNFEANVIAGPPFVTSVIARTEDGGATWSAVDSASDYPLTAVAFVNASTGWAVGKHGTILRTGDGGATWTPQSSGVKRSLWTVAFSDAGHGWIAGAEGLLLTTSDGGLTWRKITGRGTFFWDECGALAIDGSGALWAAMGTQSMSGEFDRLLRSEDGGRHWRRVDLGWDYNVWSVAALGSFIIAGGPVDTNGLGATSRMVLSSDGGETWSTRVLGEGVELRGVAAGSPEALCAVGGGTFASADGGSTWTGSGLPVAGTGSVDFVNSTEGWATGMGGIYAALDAVFGGPGGGVVLHTSDGAAWSEQLSDAAHGLMGVDFVDDQHGWVVGAEGVIYRTADGGSTWTEQAGGTRATLYDVQAPDASTAWTVGIRVDHRSAEVVLLHTTDGGAQWRAVNLPNRFIPTAMQCPSSDEVWLAGVGTEGFALRHTTDSGATWTDSTVPEEYLSTLPIDMDFIDAQHGWIVAAPIEEGTSHLLKTEDGGATWSEVGSGEFVDTDYLTAVGFADKDHGWVAGAHIYATSDGGVTWTPQVDGLEGASALAAPDADHAWAALGYGLLSTVDATGDTAAPTTISQGARGWTRTRTSIALSATDGGGPGVASTEYSLDGGAWGPYLAPVVFRAPSDHSGDGAHVVRYRSTDAAGLVEPLRSLDVRVDTVRPVCRLRPSVLGRDNVLRLRGRIDDASASYVDQFRIKVTRRGRSYFDGSWDGFRWPTGKWRTLKEGHAAYMKMPRGWYQLRLYAMDPAGNRQAVVGKSRLLVKYRAGAALPDFGVTPVRYRADAAGRGGLVREASDDLQPALDRLLSKMD